MDDKILFSKILGLRPPWLIERVVVDEKEQRIDIYVGHEPDIRVRCPECGKFYGMYDHAPERVYRHLNTCQMQTYIHVRPPRVNCPDHGVKQIDSEFGENGSEMTFALESFVIEVASAASRPPRGCADSVGTGAGMSWSGRLPAVRLVRFIEYRAALGWMRSP
jgi:transposase